ncbi:MAG: hypothetical protein EAX95_14025 [Candidatus Thorarchaeota archaeon]|nr:hypothetical protein [Candidatus Thorarchaeota archaeon]
MIAPLADYEGIFSQLFNVTAVKCNKCVMPNERRFGPSLQLKAGPLPKADIGKLRSGGYDT